MKIVTYEQDEKKREKIVRLALRKILNGVVVHAVDEEGGRIARGTLLGFMNDGRIERVIDVNDTLGFQLDEKGRIKEDDREDGKK